MRIKDRIDRFFCLLEVKWERFINDVFVAREYAKQIQAVDAKGCDYLFVPIPASMPPDQVCDILKQLEKITGRIVLPQFPEAHLRFAKDKDLHQLLPKSFRWRIWNEIQELAFRNAEVQGYIDTRTVESLKCDPMFDHFVKLKTESEKRLAVMLGMIGELPEVPKNAAKSR